MSRKKKPARYRRLRVDHRTHRKTVGFSALTRDLQQQAIEANPLGVLRASVKQMANTCGPLVPGGRKPTRKQIAAAIGELTTPRPPSPPVAEWWPDLEILWIREAADEQVMNPSMWEAISQEIVTLPPIVQGRIRARYGRQLAKVTPDGGGTQCAPTVTPHPSDQQQSPSETESRLRSQEQTRGRARAREPDTLEAKERHLEAQISRLRERLTQTGEVPQPRCKGANLGPLRVRDDQARAVLRAEYAVDDLVATAAWLSDEISAGRCQPKPWGALFWSKWLDEFVKRQVPEIFRAKPRSTPDLGAGDPVTLWEAEEARRREREARQRGAE